MIPMITVERDHDAIYDYDRDEPWHDPWSQQGWTIELM